MQPKNDQLVVRQHERVLCSLRAHVRVAEPSATQIVIARSFGDGSGTIDAEVVDCSRGGLGIQLALLLPRSCLITVQLVPNDAEAIPGDLELMGRVQRASMVDRTPRYYLGVSFRVPGPPQNDRVERLISIATSHKASSTPIAPPEGKVA